jgi:Glyoxalase/Bleomycin resistance protein/Dioxygenase superfamily
MTHATVGLFGPVRQLGYVVEDVRAGALEWVTRFGAGPFFLIEGIMFRSWSWLGQPQTLPLDIVIGQFGNVMIELVRPQHPGPSVYAHSMGKNIGGQPHHHGFLVPNFDAAVLQLNVGVAISGGFTNAGARFGYFDTRPTIGLLSELIEETNETRALMALCADAAVGWDGREPIRRISL